MRGPGRLGSRPPPCPAWVGQPQGGKCSCSGPWGRQAGAATPGGSGPHLTHSVRTRDLGLGVTAPPGHTCRTRGSPAPRPCRRRQEQAARDAGALGAPPAPSLSCIPSSMSSVTWDAPLPCRQRTVGPRTARGCPALRGVGLGRLAPPAPWPPCSPPMPLGGQASSRSAPAPRGGGGRGQRREGPERPGLAGGLQAGGLCRAVGGVLPPVHGTLGSRLLPSREKGAGSGAAGKEGGRLPRAGGAGATRGQQLQLLPVPRDICSTRLPPSPGVCRSGGAGGATGRLAGLPAPGRRAGRRGAAGSTSGPRC